MTQVTCGEVGTDTTDHDIEQLLLEAEGRVRSHDVNSAQDLKTMEVSRGQPQHTSLGYVNHDLQSPTRCSIFSFIYFCPWVKRGLTFDSIPRLSSDCSLQPYLVQKDDVAVVDTKRILNHFQDRDASNGIGFTEPKRTKGSRSNKVRH
jgi:hypothetical protein